MNLSSVTHGILCLTYDDRSFDNWVKALPLFAAYSAHATFFFSGEIDAHALKTAKLLSAHGHSVGLHTLHHADAPSFFTAHGAQAYYEKEILPQKKRLEAAGIPITAFAYPNNLRNQETDAALSPYFRHFRAGLTGAAPEEIDRPITELPCAKVMHGRGIGEYYHTETEVLLSTLQAGADANACLTFFSHDIYPGADFINMPTELLEKILQKASEAGMCCLGFDELP